jgi:cytochrome c peroxidase
MLYVIFSLLIAFSTNAQTNIDQKLQGYIEKFQLRPLDKPLAVNRKLLDLGHELFESKILSGNNNIGCIDCHHPRNMTMDGLPLGLGEGSEGIQIPGKVRSQKLGKILSRNTPGLFNLEGINVMFWDGRVSFNPTTKTFSTPTPLRPEVSAVLRSAIAAQALFPMVNHEEMRGQKGSNAIANASSDQEAWDLILNKVLSNPDFKKAFEELYPGAKINIGHVAEAIAEFQRAAFFYDQTAYDDYLKGNLTALNEVQKIGMDVFFNKGKCGECHNGQHLSNFEFHNIGTPQIGPGKMNGDDLGRYEWNKEEGNLYAFRVPPLRNVSMTAPYMHDGTFKTLPQVVEHYDMIVESFTGFNLINNWKSYIEGLTDHDHSNDKLREDSLSPKLAKRLFFEEEEEKALSEFLATALTDKRLLAREIDGNYETYYRMQLKPSGYEKLEKNFVGIKDTETFYYFDAMLEGGYFLRELAEPIRLIAVKSAKGLELIYREMAYKTAVADQGIILSGNFHREEKKIINDDVFNELENAYLDMFERIYTYNNGAKTEALPVAELDVIKADVDLMNYYFHFIDFKGAENISDKMNQKKADVFYVPTSFNSKDTTTFNLNVDGRSVKAILQKSLLRNERGGLETTYAIEFETTKVSKSEAAVLGKKIIEQLNLEASDVGGGTPSPSVLTLEVLGQIFK